MFIPFTFTPLYPHVGNSSLPPQKKGRFGNTVPAGIRFLRALLAVAKTSGPFLPRRRAPL